MAAGENKHKKNSGIKRPAIIIAACAVGFALFFTMAVDFILISLSVSPIFSGIASTKYEDSKYGTVTEGHGILYSTITAHRENFESGLFIVEGYEATFYKFFLGFKKWDDSMELDANSSEEDITVIDGYDINWEVIWQLAYGEISPFEFMERYRCYAPIQEDDGSVTYYFALPNDYVIRIGYSGDVINYIRLEDHIMGEWLDLQTQSPELDEFLLERLWQEEE